MPAQTDIVVRALRGTIERLVTTISVNIVANLQSDTPVDTGWARANWLPDIGSAPEEPEIDNPTPDLIPSADRLQESKVAELVATYTLEQGSVFVSNNVPYIVQLNEGSSGQAPAGFVQDAIFTVLENLDSQVFF